MCACPQTVAARAHEPSHRIASDAHTTSTLSAASLRRARDWQAGRYEETGIWQLDAPVCESGAQ